MTPLTEIMEVQEARNALKQATFREHTYGHLRTGSVSGLLLRLLDNEEARLRLIAEEERRVREE